MQAGQTFRIRVTPKASRNRVKLAAEEGLDFYIYTTTVPEDGKANAAVIKLLSKELGVPKSSLSVTHGQTSRHKTVCYTPL